MNLQPVLESERILMQPLQHSHFEALFDVASDPLIWEQHPNKDRYRRPVFEVFFDGALLSGGAFLVTNKENQSIMGCTRFYDFNSLKKSVFIGYTFIARQWWGKQMNHEMKRLMLDHAFLYVDEVYFHVGSSNIRSQIAMERLGGVQLRKITVAYHGEAPKENVEYLISKSYWQNRNQNT
jgi:RimJ/RimL family protein N-acetyltransferase